MNSNTFLWSSMQFHCPHGFQLLSLLWQASTAQCLSTAHRKHGQRTDNNNKYKKKVILFWGRKVFRGMNTSYVISFITTTGKKIMTSFIWFTSIDAISRYIFTILNWTTDHPCNSAVHLPSFLGCTLYKTNCSKALSKICPKSNKYLISGPWFLVNYLFMFVYFRNINMVVESLYIHCKKTGILNRLLQYSASLSTINKRGSLGQSPRQLGYPSYMLKIQWNKEKT